MEKMNWFSHAGLAVVCALFLVLSFGCAGTMTGGKSQAAITILIGYLLERFDVQIPIIAQRPPNGQTLSEIKGKASTGVKFANEDFTFRRED